MKKLLKSLLLVLLIIAVIGTLIAIAHEKVDTKVLSLHPATKSSVGQEQLAALDLTPILGNIETTASDEYITSTATTIGQPEVAGALCPVAIPGIIADDAYYNEVAALCPVTVGISLDDEMMTFAKKASYHRVINRPSRVGLCRRDAQGGVFGSNRGHRRAAYRNRSVAWDCCTSLGV